MVRELYLGWEVEHEREGCCKLVRGYTQVRDKPLWRLELAGRGSAEEEDGWMDVCSIMAGK
jgi:hypothetical protein